MTSTEITATIKLFAVYQEEFEAVEISRQFPANTSVSEVLERLIIERPNLARWREVTRFGLNLDFVEPETIVRDGDEVVLIPPVSGG